MLSKLSCGVVLLPWMIQGSSFLSPDSNLRVATKEKLEQVKQKPLLMTDFTHIPLTERIRQQRESKTPTVSSIDPKTIDVSDVTISTEERRLHRGDNFIVMTTRGEQDCTNDPVTVWGYLVNTCYQDCSKDEFGNVECLSSWALKANSKHATFIQMVYLNNGECAGFPDHIDDLTKFIGTQPSGECLDGNSLEYVDHYYPVETLPHGVLYTFNNYNCGEENQYVLFDYYPSNACYLGYTFDCYTGDDGTVHITKNVYDSETCAGDPTVRNVTPRSCANSTFLNADGKLSIQCIN